MRLLTFYILLILSGPALAELIDKGEYTTDTETGLDWLDLSATTGLSWNQAVTQTTGWRPATKQEVNTLFMQAFASYDNSKSKSESLLDGYAEQLEDIHAFNKLFGFTFNTKTETFTLGLYKTPEGVITAMGGREVFSDGRMPHRNFVFGMKWQPYEPYSADTVLPHAGTFMVRPTAGKN